MSRSTMRAKSVSGGGVPNKSFQSPEFWDEFFKARKGQAFEWYTEWGELWPSLRRHCGLEAAGNSGLTILVPGCGSSQISAAMYDEGFTSITNIDLCRDVIADMLRAHLRQRPKMLWKVMDMTKMQFADGSFDIVVDKGGLDALMGEPDEDPAAGKRFLSEVKRILKPRGRYACITLAEKHIIGVLVSTFRHGWHVEIHQISTKEVSKGLFPFLVVATKGDANELSDIDISTLELVAVSNQVSSLKRVIENENLLRSRGATEDPSSYDFEKIFPGRKVVLTLGGKGKSKTTYKAIVLDAKEGCEIRSSCGVFLVPKNKTHEWVYSSEEGQWQVVESAKARRLIMVYLETNLQPSNSSAIQDDLSPLVRGLIPACENRNPPFLMPDDGALKGKLLEEIHSPLTGTMLVEDVVDKKGDCLRRLFFKRNPNLIQSEALLSVIKNGHSSGKKKNRTQEVKVDHSYLASPYHAGMIAGLSLIAANFESWISSKVQVRTMVVGLGAGLLPMFLYKHLPFSTILVVELDLVVGDLAKRHFGFVEDERMQLHVGDGVAAVEALADGEQLDKLHVLIIDADSADPSNGLSCPPAEFLQEAFLRKAKASLSEDGIFVINLVSRAREPHSEAISKLSQIFEEVYSLQIDEDVNRVLFALSRSSPSNDLGSACATLKRIATQFAPWQNGPSLKTEIKDLKRLK